jgi:Protein of unknown function (DUF3631)
MRRKTKGDKVERWLLQRTAPEAEQLHDRIAAWAKRATSTLTNATPELPEALTDRQQEAWWALLAVADLAGGEWPEAARDAAVSLAAVQDDVSVGVRLLAALRDLMANRSAISTAALLAEINANVELPFGGWSDGKGLDARDLARRLRRYDITPGTIRLADGSTPKGYRRDWFLDAWTRYVPPVPPHTKASNHGAGGAPAGPVAAVADCGDRESGTAATAEWAANADRPRACRCGGPENPEGNCMMCGLVVVGVSR